MNHCEATGLTNSAPYYVSIAAQNGGGYGACSASVGPVTPAGVPDAPTITGITPSVGSLNVQWTKPHTNGMPITGYFMEYSTSGSSGPWREATGGCGSQQISLAEPLTCEATGLSAGQTYYFRVAAVSKDNATGKVGLGLWSNIYQGIPADAVPIGNPDQYLMPQGGTLNTTAANGLNKSSVLDNDINVVYAGYLTLPAHGTLLINHSGGLIYTPEPSFTGTDSFQYVGTNGTSSRHTAPTTVTIVVSPTNLPPIANADTYKVTAGNTLTIKNLAGVLNNDSDPEHHSLTASVLNGPVSGTLQNFDPLGGFVYVPNPGFEGTDQFTYAASDGSLQSAPVTVTIVVRHSNHAPIANAINWSTAQDVELNVSTPGVLANDTDADRDALNASLATSTSHGSVTLSPNGSFRYIPNPGYSGTDSFTYVASDGSLSSSPAVVTLTINAVVSNLPPIGVPDLFYVAQGKTLSVTRAGGVLANDVDPENHLLSRRILSQSVHGSFSPVDAGGFTYIPDPSFSGVDSFTYEVSDGQLTVGPITAKLVVLPVNKKPQANPDAWSLAQDTQVAVDPLNGILVNDVDPQGSTLKPIYLTQPAHGLLNPIDGGGFGYIPQAGFAGQDSFTYKVTNGVLESDPTTVYLTVNAVPNRKPPVANPDYWVVEMNQVLDVPDRGLLVNDYSPQGVPLYASPFTQPAHGTLTMLGGGGFTYTPNAGFIGQDSFFYTAIGGGLGSQPALVKINVSAQAIVPKAPAPTKIKLPAGTKVTVPPPSNQQPVTGAKPLPPKPSDGPGRIVIVTPPTNGSATINPDGGYVYTPNPGFGGTDAFTIATSNGGSVSTPSPVAVTVNSPDSNRAPVAVPSTYRSLSGDSVIYSNSKGLLRSARDPDGDFLKAIIVTYPEHGYLDLQKNGEFAYYPEPGFKGVDTFTWKASDGLLESDIVMDRLICTSCSRRE